MKILVSCVLDFFCDKWQQPTTPQPPTACETYKIENELVADVTLIEVICTGQSHSHRAVLVDLLPVLFGLTRVLRDGPLVAQAEEYWLHAVR